MMVSKEFSMTTEELGEFFYPIIEAYTKMVEVVLSQSKNIDLSESQWKIIPETGRMGKFKKLHAVVDSWDQFDLFLKREAKIYGFIEEKRSGLVEVDFIIWAFFSPATASNFFNNLMEKPKHFNAKAIIPLPYVKLLDPIIEKLDYTLSDDSIRVSAQISTALQILDLGEQYLNEQDFTILDSHIKKSIARLILSETNQLMKDIKKPNVLPVLLKNRLNGLFRIGWRYYRSKNELEARYFKKLLSEDPVEQEKGLKLTHKKVTDFKNESTT